MENLKNKELINEEIGKQLFSELIVLNRKFIISKILIVLTLITLPSILILNMLSILSLFITLVSIPFVLVWLVFSIRMYNHTRMYCSIHTWLLDGGLEDSINKVQ